MSPASSSRDRLPSAETEKDAGELPTGEAFRPEWIDFERGIRVGNLESHKRIAQILKFHLESRYHTPFVTDRWGRGAFWQWMCGLPRTNREAKPVSRDVNFGCAKLFIPVEQQRLADRARLRARPGAIPRLLAETGLGLAAADETFRDAAGKCSKRGWVGFQL